MTLDFKACVALAGLCIAFGGYLDKEYNPVNTSMKRLLERSRSFNHYYIKEICDVFVKSFDYVFVNRFKHPLISYWLWVVIFICWGILLFFIAIGRLAYFSYPVSENGLVFTPIILSMSTFFVPSYLIISILFVGPFAISIPGYNYLFDQLVLIIKKERKIIFSSYGENKVRDIPVLNYLYDLMLLARHIRKIINEPYAENKFSRGSVPKCFFVSTCVAIFTITSMMLMAIIVRFGMNTQAMQESMQESGFPDLGFFHMDSLHYYSLFILMSLFVGVMFFIPSVYVYLFLLFIEKHRSLFDISPLIVMLNSIVAIALVAALNIDLVTPFIMEGNKFFVEFLPFIFLNILSDSLSILETRYMLSKVISGTPGKLVLFLFLDFLVSSLIYLIVPILNGDLKYFLDAILFKGQIAWVGIFYWSSLFTSIFLYMYVLGFFGMHILYKCSNIKYLVEKPSYSLGWILASIVMIFYLFSLGWEILTSHIFFIILLLLLVLLITKIFKKVSANN
ncbi:hypothetical protein [Methanosarcina mazei]|uniref:Uncharacterized protein n=1 Tax=Methanosarcina mazei S-6 TaxID=213585 RepID=A0A0E3LUT9_METMZ|nr:hypothetical protein [Methanosarcina mazei]AKB65851.1 hypothetical protein MSMAS_2655 [Methanosarcina mazei S-6]